MYLFTYIKTDLETLYTVNILLIILVLNKFYNKGELIKSLFSCLLGIYLSINYLLYKYK